MITIIYPYKKSRWQHELRYSLRSIAKFLKIDHHIIIYSDCKLDYLKNIEIIVERQPESKIKKIPKSQYAQGFIYQKIIARNDITDFYYFNDDIYLLKPTFTLSKIYKLNSRQIIDDPPQRPLNPWHRLLYETRIQLAMEGKTSFNFETHLPYFLNCDKLAKLPKVLMGENLLATTYYNTYLNNTTDVPLCTDIKIGSYNRRNIKEKIKKMGTAKFFNHNDAGILLAIKQLPILFPEKCRYEK